MTSSAFNYGIIPDGDTPIIWIVDKNIGSMSVTRDIDNVCNEICDKNLIERENACDYLWIYADTDLVWDGYDPITENIVELACDSALKAIRKYRRIRNKEMRMLVNSQVGKFEGEE